jgi:hypothetical protein
MKKKNCLTELNLKQIVQEEKLSQPVEAARLLGRQLELFLRGGTVYVVWLDQNGSSCVPVDPAPPPAPAPAPRRARKS